MFVVGVLVFAIQLLKAQSFSIMNKKWIPSTHFAVPKLETQSINPSSSNTIDVSKLVDRVKVSNAEIVTSASACGSLLRSFVASSALSSGTEIARLPWQACLVSNNLNKNIPLGCEKIWAFTQQPSDRLAILLLNEWKLGAQSTFHRYIINLPPPGSRKVSPMYWEDTVLMGFPYSSLSLEAMKQRRQWCRLYDILLSLPNFHDLTYDVSKS
jgi:hypothetical protein